MLHVWTEGNTENENETDQLFNLQFLPQQTARLTIVAYKSANIHMWCVTILEHYPFNAKHAVKLKINYFCYQKWSSSPTKDVITAFQSILSIYRLINV